MDGKFRLVFCDVGDPTPKAGAYVADNVQTFDRLKDALQAARTGRDDLTLPYIAHRFIVLDPMTIGILCDEFLASPT